MAKEIVKDDDIDLDDIDDELDNDESYDLDGDSDSSTEPSTLTPIFCRVSLLRLRTLLSSVSRAASCLRNSAISASFVSFDSFADFVQFGKLRDSGVAPKTAYLAVNGDKVRTKQAAAAARC